MNTPRSNTCCSRLPRTRTRLPYTQEGSAARALEFLILTAARTDEVLAAKWSEIDLARRHWTVPANRMKGREVHRVPLSDAALQVLEAMQQIQINDHVFPGGSRIGSLGAGQLRRVIKALGRAEPRCRILRVHVHGFRSTFRDWAGDTKHAREDAQMAIAHKVAGKSERAYWRSDLFAKRRRLMADWARFCGGREAFRPRIVAGTASAP
jgi:integrase